MTPTGTAARRIAPAEQGWPRGAAQRGTAPLLRVRRPSSVRPAARNKGTNAHHHGTQRLWAVRSDHPRQLVPSAHHESPVGGGSRPCPYLAGRPCSSTISFWRIVSAGWAWRHRLHFLSPPGQHREKRWDTLGLAVLSPGPATGLGRRLPVPLPRAQPHLQHSLTHSRFPAASSAVREPRRHDTPGHAPALQRRHFLRAPRRFRARNERGVIARPGAHAWWRAGPGRAGRWWRSGGGEP